MTLVLLAILYGFADLLFGAKHPAFTGKKAAILGSLVVGSYLLGDATTALLGLAFFINRTIAPDKFGTDFTPTGKERIGAFLRYATTVPMGAVVAAVSGGDVIKTSIAMLVWSGVATAISSWYGEEEAKAKARGEPIDPEANTLVEFGRGFAFGLLTGLV